MMEAGKLESESREQLVWRRREFLKNSGILALLSTISIQVVGCEGDKDAVESIEVARTPDRPDAAAQPAPEASGPADMDAREAPMEPESPTPSEPSDPVPSDPEPEPPTTPDPEPRSCTTISGDSTTDFGHVHSFTLGAIQQQIALPVTLRLNCAGGHIHTVGLSRPDLLAICAGSLVVKESSFDAGHTHSVMFNA